VLQQLLDFGETTPKRPGRCDYQLLTSQQPPVEKEMLRRNFGSGFSNFAKHLGNHQDNFQKKSKIIIAL
jgi:hypothetical protein